MKNLFRSKLIKRIFVIAISVAVLFIGLNVYSKGQIDTVRAFGDLVVDFHVPLGNPIFVVSNMKPGDFQAKPVDVTNNGSVASQVAVKGLRTGGIGADPKIETALDIVITNGVTPVYGIGSSTGDKTLAQFFADSATVNGVALGTIGPAEHKTYNFKVTFPYSAGNDFQAKSVIFNLTFGVVTNPTRTQGFWSTHVDFANSTWNGVVLAGENTLCPPSNRVVTDTAGQGANMLMGGFWSNVAKTTTNTKRSALDQARMQLAQQLLAAILNKHVFGTDDGGLIAQGKTAYCGSDRNAILTIAGQLGTYNQSGDNIQVNINFGSANPKLAQSQANQPSWDVLP